MLKRHQACIDLAKDALVIQGREIKFLAEHELPKHFQGGDDDMELDEYVSRALILPPGTHLALLFPGKVTPSPPPAPPAAPSSAPTTSTSATPFPGSGHTLSTPTTPPAPAPTPPAAAGGFPEADITGLMNLGVGREEAIRFLEATGGNMETAANLIFSGGTD